MNKWKATARARELGIPEETLDGIAPVLDALEAAFRPLAATLTEDVEPAVTFRAGEDEQ